MTRNDPLAAHAALEAAEAKIREAEQARDQAAAELDAALAQVGWKRAHGGFANPLYEHVRTPGFLTPLAQVLEAVVFDRRAAA